MKSYNFIESNKKLIFKAIGDMLDEIVNAYPDNECVVSIPENVRFTYKEFNEELNKVAKSFLKLGIKKGNRIAIWSTNNVA